MNKVEKYLKQKGYMVTNSEFVSLDFGYYYSFKLELLHIKENYKIKIELNTSFNDEEELIAKFEEILK